MLLCTRPDQMFTLSATLTQVCSHIGHSARANFDVSVYGKAWSVFGRPIEMLTQDSCKFYNAHSVYNSYGGVVLAAEEGERIAEALGPQNKACILRNHGLLTVGHTVDE